MLFAGVYVSGEIIDNRLAEITETGEGDAEPWNDAMLQRRKLKGKWGYINNDAWCNRSYLSRW